MNPATGWPAVGWETLVWQPSYTTTDIYADPPIHGSRYRSSIPPHIASLTPRLNSSVLSAAHDAAQELGRLDAEVGDRVAAYAPILLRSEAASSSQIENLTASARAIFSAELGANTGQNAQLIAANTRALVQAIDGAANLSVEAIRAMHAILMAGQPRHTPGRWREEAVWIGTRSDTPIGAEFVAPHHDQIASLMTDLIGFARRNDLPALAAVAISHAQFETIHPFTDGNGRTGRALSQAQLRYRGVTRNIAVPVSAGLLADIEGYHAALTSYRAGDAGPIVAAFSAAALRAVANTRELVKDVTQIRDSWTTRLTARRHSHAWRLLDLLARQPVLNSASAAQELGIKQPNVYPPMRALVDAGIAQSKNEHHGGPFWRSDEILEAVDRFAERAGRRQKS